MHPKINHRETMKICSRCKTCISEDRPIWAFSSLPNDLASSGPVSNDNAIRVVCNLIALPRAFHSKSAQQKRSNTACPLLLNYLEDWRLACLCATSNLCLQDHISKCKPRVQQPILQDSETGDMISQGEQPPAETDTQGLETLADGPIKAASGSMDVDSSDGPFSDGSSPALRCCSPELSRPFFFQKR